MEKTVSAEEEHPPAVLAGLTVGTSRWKTRYTRRYRVVSPRCDARVAASFTVSPDGGFSVRASVLACGLYRPALATWLPGRNWAWQREQVALKQVAVRTRTFWHWQE